MGRDEVRCIASYRLPSHVLPKFIGGSPGPASILEMMDLPFLRFTEGATRLVYTDRRGQYVLDDQGEPVYGTWLHPDEYQDASQLSVPVN